MAKLTAVEWLVSELNQKIDFIPIDKWDMIRDIVQQAKQMEKDQMHKVAEYWHFNGIADEYFDDYYNEIFGK